MFTHAYIYTFLLYNNVLDNAIFYVVYNYLMTVF